MRKLWRRLYFLLHRRRLERELAEEMEAHREMMPADRRSQFGNTTRLREESRDAWSWIWLDSFRQDLAYGVRVLRRAPGFTLGAVAVLALGVGANLAEFQIFDAMIFHRSHFGTRMSCLQFTRASRAGTRLGFPSAAVEFYQAENSSFAWLVSEDTSFRRGGGQARPGCARTLYPRTISAASGIVPAWGRLLDARDGQPGAPAVAVLGYEYWQTRWGGDPHVVGRVVRVNDQPVQIVGVLPYSFDGLWPRGRTCGFRLPSGRW